MFFGFLVFCVRTLRIGFPILVSIRNEQFGTGRNVYHGVDIRLLVLRIGGEFTIGT